MSKDLSDLARNIVEICKDPNLQNYKPVFNPGKKTRIGNGVNSQSKETMLANGYGTVIHDHLSNANGINLDRCLKAAVAMYGQNSELGSDKQKISMQRDELIKLGLAINKLQRINKDDPELNVMKERQILLKKRLDDSEEKNKEKTKEAKTTHAKRALKILCANSKTSELLHKKILSVMAGNDPDLVDVQSHSYDKRGPGNFRRDNNNENYSRGPMSEKNVEKFIDDKDNNWRKIEKKEPDLSLSKPTADKKIKPIHDKNGNYGHMNKDRYDRLQKPDDNKVDKNKYIPPHQRNLDKNSDNEIKKKVNMYEILQEPVIEKVQPVLEVIVSKPLPVTGAWAQYKKGIIGSKLPDIKPVNTPQAKPLAEKITAPIPPKREILDTYEDPENEEEEEDDNNLEDEEPEIDILKYDETCAIIPAGKDEYDEPYEYDENIDLI